MNGYFYLYKGPKESLFTLYVCSLYIYRDIPDSKYQNKFPSAGRIFDYDVKYPNLIIENAASFIYIDIINHDTYERLGEYAIPDSRKRLYNAGQSLGVLCEKNVYIKEVTNPQMWYEKYTVIKAAEYRRGNIVTLAESFNLSVKELNQIERSVDEQINLLMNLPLLPPECNWIKTMKAFRDVYPKPSWWDKEMNHYNQTIKEKI